MRSKLQHYKPYRSLKQLPISKQLWNSISIDFIEKLLLSSRFDTILVIVNQLTKQAIFIPAYNTITFMNLACLFVLHMFSKHGVSSHVISNRGLEFVSNFFCSLDITLNMQLHFTSGYHSECDIAFSQVCNFAVDLNELQSILKAEISMVQQCYQKSADAWRSPTSDFKVGNKVFIKA